MNGEGIEPKNTDREEFRDFRFIPWVGQNFGAHSIFRAGILLVGESHYAESSSWKAEDA